jgi:hypothetical protein
VRSFQPCPEGLHRKMGTGPMTRSAPLLGMPAEISVDKSCLLRFAYAGSGVPTYTRISLPDRSSTISRGRIGDGPLSGLIPAACRSTPVLDACRPTSEYSYTHGLNTK